MSIAIMASKFARIGELTSIITMISPLPCFIFCHKKAHEKNKMVDQISYNFLLALMVMNMVWVSYAFKIDNNDILVINSLGLFVSLVFLSLYLYVKIKIGKVYREMALLISTIPFLIWSCSNQVGPNLTGLLASTLSMTSYLFTLDKVKKILETKDPDQINLGVAIAAGFNGTAWMGYSILITDFFVFLPNIGAIAASVI